MNLSIERALKKIEKGNGTLLIDIDGVICSTESNKYDSSEPDENMIALINSLYDKGNIIKIFTARGSSSGIDWESYTKMQLINWGLKYHELIVGKPSCDLIVDDIAIRPDELLDIL
jgi:hypothetical protein